MEATICQLQLGGGADGSGGASSADAGATLDAAFPEVLGGCALGAFATATAARALDVDSFARALAELCAPPSDTARFGSTTYLVFDDAHLLQSMPGGADLVAALAHLDELSRRSVFVVLISRAPWTHLPTLPLSRVMAVRFPAYSSEDLVRILEQSRPRECGNAAAFRSFCSMVVGHMRHVTRCLRELRHLLRLLYPRFIQLLRTNAATSPSTLQSLMKYHLLVCFNHAGLRDLTPAQLDELARQVATRTGGEDYVTTGAAAAAAAAAAHSPGVGLLLDMPTMPKIVILAAFLASYNPQDLDAKYFVADSSAKRRRKAPKPRQQAAAARGLSQHIIGPRLFEHKRMVAIFHHLAADIMVRACVCAELRSQCYLSVHRFPNPRVCYFIPHQGTESARDFKNVDLYSHIATLATQGTLKRAVQSNDISFAKYQMTLPFETVKAIGAYL
jgi:hypothetical protein